MASASAISSPLPTLPGAAGGSAPSAASGADNTGDRFLKMLVAQMKNQDPLNPMDNAQVTSQMAQINTVNGIERLNATVQGLNTQFVQLQALQGAALVGRDVSLPGDRLAIADGVGRATFEISSAADKVRLEVLGPGDQVVSSQDLGPLAGGRHSVEWPADRHTDAEGLRYRVVATNGPNVINTTLYMRDHVESVSAGADSLTLELARSGTVPYNVVKTIN